MRPNSHVSRCPKCHVGRSGCSAKRLNCCFTLTGLATHESYAYVMSLCTRVLKILRSKSFRSNPGKFMVSVKSDNNTVAIWLVFVNDFHGSRQAYIRAANNGRIRLSVSTASRTYELSEGTHVTPFRKYGNIWLGPVLTDREFVPTANYSPVSPFLRFVVTEHNRMKSVCTEGCHMGLFRESVGTACCTYGQSNATIGKQILWRKYASIICGDRATVVLIIVITYRYTR